MDLRFLKDLILRIDRFPPRPGPTGAAPGPNRRSPAQRHGHGDDAKTLQGITEIAKVIALLPCSRG